MLLYVYLYPWVVYSYISHSLFIHSLLGGYLACFYFGVNMNKTVGFQFSAGTYVVILVGSIPRSEMAGLYGQHSLPNCSP